MSRTRICPLRDIGFLLRLLRAVLRAALATVLHTDRIQRAADHVIANTREILDAAAANQHHRMLLQVMANARYIGVDLIAVGEPDARNLAQRRVRLLGRSRLDLGADAALL